MHRSGSTTRASDEFHVMNQVRSAMDMDQLPTYDPQSELSKKEASRMKFSESLVHLIPLVLILCALVLWFCSYPEIDRMNRDDSVIARVKNMTLEGYTFWNGSSTVGTQDLNPVEGITMEDSARDLGTTNTA